MLDSDNGKRCAHARTSHGLGSIYECLDCGTQVPFYHVATMRREDARPDAPKFAMVEHDVARRDEDHASCDHARVSQKAYPFYQRGPAPLLAHQCLTCGEPVVPDLDGR